MQSWIVANNADAQLDFKTFELEIKARNRYYRLVPQFIARMDGRLAHVGNLTKEANGFIGWLPYKPVRWDMSSDKLVFKRFLEDADIATPAYSVGAQSAAYDFLLKRSVGSFGYELYGPYLAGTTAPVPEAGPIDRGELFAEQFIEGRNLKVWFWGAKAFYAHLHAYPIITGDGKSTVGEIVARTFEKAGQSLTQPREIVPVRSSLAFQHIRKDQVLPEGVTAWLDYRYGRLFTVPVPVASSDSNLESMTPEALEQINRIGSVVATGLQREFPAPVLYSLDAVLDDAGKIWWLEMNSNPILPPDGYAVILDNLFGIQRPQPVEQTLPPQAIPLTHGQPQHAH